MSSSISLFLLVLFLAFELSSSSLTSLTMGSSLSVEKAEQDTIVSSPNGTFSAGFFEIGDNAYSFAIWFTEPDDSQNNTPTVVWMANRDEPVNGKLSKISLSRTGNLDLTDAGQFLTWSSNTESNATVELYLRDDGNLVLHELKGPILWQSFDFPTDTLLPGQQLTRHTELVSSRSDTNYSSGFYKLSFDDENVLRLVYDGPEVSSAYWPAPWLVSWEAGRSTYNSSRIGVLGSLGRFNSTDTYTTQAFDYGVVLQRRLKMDCDGNLRIWSRENALQKWYVSWQAIYDSCTIHGICGANSLCSFDPKNGRKCSCVPGYRVKNHSDWSYGCEPIFPLSCNESDFTFLPMERVEHYGYDNNYFVNRTYSFCENLCAKDCNCKGFQHSYDEGGGFYKCFTKTQLLNGEHSSRVNGITYFKVPKNKNISTIGESVKMDDVLSVQIQREYFKKHVSRFLSFFLWFDAAIGALEMACIFVVWLFLIRSRQKTHVDQHVYQLAAVGFRRFSYSELKVATKGFKQEIGRGSGGVVYKGILSDQRVAAIKKLNNETKQGEGEFLAEAGIIGRLNHMNLIEMWGYCAEGKHRLLVYEYMENGSLADNLSSNTLDWTQRYNIALGTAKCLAYLHEECLEWILHCDIKPQNILLDSNYHPKVADFGLSKLLNRDNNLNNSNFSMIRGTRGYMAPEWVFNLSITSKVDVFSYGIVLLEMITGRNPTMDIQALNGGEPFNGRLVTWVREKKREENWVEEIMDPTIGSNYDVNKIKLLAKVALDCVEEDKDARPTMSQVVEMLQSHDNDITN